MRRHRMGIDWKQFQWRNKIDWKQFQCRNKMVLKVCWSLRPPQIQ
jgi:hypothetical protein